MEIRRITEDDIINNEMTIKNLIEENYRINFNVSGDLSELACNGYDNMLGFLRDGSAILIGAFDKENLIGFLWAYCRTIMGERKIHITQIIVGSKARGSGIGKQMLQILEGIAFDIDVKKIELMATVENKRTINFYKKNGFLIKRVQMEKNLVEQYDPYISQLNKNY